MMKLMKFIFTPRYNRFDLVWVMVAASLVTTQNFISALVVVLVGAFVSAVLEVHLIEKEYYE